MTTNAAKTEDQLDVKLIFGLLASLEHVINF